MARARHGREYGTGARGRGTFGDRGWVSTLRPLAPESRGGPRIAIFGHTHAARHVDLGDGRVYLNTGTWMDLMKLPALEDDAEARAWIDRLEAGDIERVRRPTYAEVTEEGAALRTWPSS